MTKFTKLSTALALALATPIAANAALLFDPDGIGSLSAVSIDTFVWNPTSVLAEDGNRAIADYIADSAAGSLDPTGAKYEFTVLTHVKLGSGKLGKSTKFDLDLQTSGAAEITAVIGFRERVTSATVSNSGQGEAEFTFLSTGTNFVEMFYDSSADSDPLTGSGYDDGISILKSTVTSGIGAFNSDQTAGSEVLLDQFEDDDYSGQETVVGQGGTADIVVVLPPTTIDGNFFKSLPLIKFVTTNVDLITPYTSTDPSKGFYKAYTGSGTPDVTPLIGSINGSLTDGDDDFTIATLFSSSVNAAVPEPASMALFGLGLGALGMVGARRRRQA